MVIANHRYGFSSIGERRKFLWPGGKKVAVYIAINIEWFSFGEGKGATIVPSASHDAVVNYAWRDYGNRVGVDRLRRFCDQLNIVPTLVVNTSSYEFAREIVKGFDSFNPEIVAHGETNSVSQDGMTVEEERRMIEGCRATIQSVHGKPPSGWLSPWIAETEVTSDILSELGYEYTLNWCSDDQPFGINTKTGTLLSVPYPQELNDIPSILGRGIDAYTFGKMIIDTYRELSEYQEYASVMGIAVHPYIIAQPHRMVEFRRVITELRTLSEIWWTTPGQIAQYFSSEVGDIRYG